MGKFSDFVANNKPYKAMGDPKQTIWEEVVQFLIKLGVWAIYIIPTIVAKLAWDRKNGQLTKTQIFLKVIICLFIGYLCAVICESYGWTKEGRFAVPVATLWSDMLMNLIMSKQEQAAKVIDAWLPKWLKKK